MIDKYTRVSREEALTAACPACGATAGNPCTYLVNNYKPGPYPGWGTRRPEHLVHARGSEMTDRVHGLRKEVVRARRAVIRDRERQQERLHERVQYQAAHPVVPISRNARQAAVAMQAWDLAEYERLRDWLRDWGWLLTEANLPHRPDGTLRGETYLFGDPS